MALFNIPNLCGANPAFNTVQANIDSLKQRVASNVESEASELSLTSGLVTLSLNLSGLMSKKPTLNDISLQVEIKDLLSISVGTSQYKSKLSKIDQRFGTMLTKKELVLANLLGESAALILAGNDICGLVPNLTIPVIGGAVVELAKNVTQADSNAESETPSTITTPVEALDSANEISTARFIAATKQFAKIVPKIKDVVGSSGRVNADVRQAFREADIKVVAAMIAAGISSSPTDQRLLDIEASDEHLEGGTGTSSEWVNPDVTEQTFERTITSGVSKLNELTSNLGGLIAKSVKAYPENLDSTGKKVFYKVEDISTYKNTHSKAVRLQSEYVNALTSNQSSISWDVNNPIVNNFKTDMSSLEAKIKTVITDFEKISIRDVDSNDKIIEQDIPESKQSIPNIEDFNF